VSTAIWLILASLNGVNEAIKKKGRETWNKFEIRRHFFPPKFEKNASVQDLLL